MATFRLSNESNNFQIVNGNTQCSCLPLTVMFCMVLTVCVLIFCIRVLHQIFKNYEARRRAPFYPRAHHDTRPSPALARILRRSKLERPVVCPSHLTRCHVRKPLQLVGIPVAIHVNIYCIAVMMFPICNVLNLNACSCNPPPPLLHAMAKTDNIANLTTMPIPTENLFAICTV